MAATAALKAKPPAGETARRALRTRTIPEQIADHVAVAIIKGEYRDGEHLPEQKIAALFDVSHGPVREAIRTLSKRGLVEFQPRRGAFVIGVTLMRSPTSSTFARCCSALPRTAWQSFPQNSGRWGS